MNKRIVFISIIFGLVKTNYFGWDFTPKSEAEVICDGIMFLILALAMVKIK